MAALTQSAKPDKNTQSGLFKTDVWDDGLLKKECFCSWLIKEFSFIIIIFLSVRLSIFFSTSYSFQAIGPIVYLYL